MFDSVLDFLQKNGECWFTVSEIAHHLNCNMANVHAQLKRLRPIIRYYKINEDRILIKTIKGVKKSVKQRVPVTYYSIKIKDNDIIFSKCMNVQEEQ